jgi:hypothetical protein
MDPETSLMQSIYSQWGELIDSACKLSSVPPAFLAALVANESGGVSVRKRFEPHVLAALWQVLMGRTAAYGSIGRDDVLKFVMNADPASTDPLLLGNSPSPLFGVTTEMLLFDTLATSWGLVQIMGYEAVEFHTNGVKALQSPSSELPIALKMLAQFAQRFDLDLAMKPGVNADADAAGFFSCWNTGRPHSPTADPLYVPNGLKRMKIYAQLLQEYQVTQ